MRLYDYPGAPNPRRVKIFAAEKDINLQLIDCDISKRAHKTPEFLIKIQAVRSLSLSWMMAGVFLSLWPFVNT